MFPTLAAHVASFGWEPKRAPFDARGLEGAVAQLRRLKITGMAVASSKAGDLLLDDEQETELAEAQAALAALMLEIDSLTLRSLDALGSSGLAVLKGMAHAQLDYPDPSWREYGDVDLLVADERMVEVVQWFESHGFSRVFAPFAPRWEGRFGKSVTLQSNGLEVDLHRGLSQGLALGIDSTALVVHRSTYVHAGVEVPTLDPAARLVHAAVHALGGSETPPLTGLIDIAHMAAVPGRLDAAIRLAGSWDVSLTLADGMRVAAERAGGIRPSELALIAGVGGSANERLRRRILDRPGHGFRNDLLAGFVSLRGVSRRAQFVSSLVADHVLPDRGRRP